MAGALRAHADSVMMLDPDHDRAELDSALRDYHAGTLSLPDMRKVAETIVHRWRDPARERPPFAESENALWNVVWEIITGCRESLGAGGAARLRAILEGEIELQKGGPQLRP